MIGSNQQQPGSGVSPFVTGAATGAAGMYGVQYVQNTRKIADWGLGLGVLLGALAVVSSSDLNSAQNTATSLAAQAQGFPISAASTASLGSLSADVQNLRAHQIAQDNLMAQLAYAGNWFSFTQPTLQNAPVQAGAITPTAIASNTTSSGFIVLAIAALVVIVLIVA